MRQKKLDKITSPNRTAQENRRNLHQQTKPKKSVDGELVHGINRQLQGSKSLWPSLATSVCSYFCLLHSLKQLSCCSFCLVLADSPNTSTSTTTQWTSVSCVLSMISLATVTVANSPAALSPDQKDLVELCGLVQAVSCGRATHTTAAQSPGPSTSAA